MYVLSYCLNDGPAGVVFNDEDDNNGLHFMSEVLSDPTLAHLYSPSCSVMLIVDAPPCFQMPDDDTPDCLVISHVCNMLAPGEMVTRQCFTMADTGTYPDYGYGAEGNREFHRSVIHDNATMNLATDRVLFA